MFTFQKCLQFWFQKLFDTITFQMISNYNSQMFTIIISKMLAIKLSKIIIIISVLADNNHHHHHDHLCGGLKGRIVSIYWTSPNSIVLCSRLRDPFPISVSTFVGIALSIACWIFPTLARKPEQALSTCQALMAPLRLPSPPSASSEPEGPFLLDHFAHGSSNWIHVGSNHLGSRSTIASKCHRWDNLYFLVCIYMALATKSISMSLHLTSSSFACLKRPMCA